MQNSNKPRKFKIVLLGNRAVGKSSIIRRYILDDFPHEIQPTIGVDYMSKTICYKGAEYRLQLWDTAGQQKYRSLVKGYLKGAHACLYVYDCKNINSYMGLVEWISLFQSANTNNYVSFLAGNKWDLCNKEDQQSLQKAKCLFKQNQSKLNEFQQLHCSAKTSENINDIFIRIVQKIIQQQKFALQKGSTLLMRKSLTKMASKCCQS